MRVLREQFASERQRVADAEAELDMQLANEGEVQKAGVGDTAWNTTLRGYHSRDAMLGKEVVGPLCRGVDGK